MNKPVNISKLLEVSEGSVISVIGCGGKSSLIELIASENKDKKVLVSPTTKMFPAVSDKVMLCDTLQSCIEHKPQTGVQYLGQFNSNKGVLEALPELILSEMIKNYDIVLLEGDGSRSKPCKGWRDHEPVVPDFSTHTIGVVTMEALGKKATNEVVHHLEEFLTLTGLNEGEEITISALEDMICSPGGMFKRSIGKLFLVIANVEDDYIIYSAKKLLKNVIDKYPGRFKRLVYGNTHVNEWNEE